MNEESSDVNETISEGDVNFSEEIDSLEAEQTSQDKPVEDVVTTKKQTEVNVSSEFVTIKATATGCPQKNATHFSLYISVRINATVLCFMWKVIGCPSVCFAYRHRSDG